MHLNDDKMIGFNNIELITDRPLEVNLREIKQVKRDWPDRAMVVSLMVPCEETAWSQILSRVEETGADAVELNFGCPHGMSERGMGSAVGQVPDYVEMVARWCKAHTRMPVLVKLTPNVTNILGPARAARKGGADGVSLINTINSITSIDLDLMAPTPTVDGKGTHGGYCGPAVKPIALHMVAEIARDAATHGMPISAIGGIATWRDAAEFMALSAGTVQVCTAAMHYGFKIVDDMIDGLSNWMDSQGYARIEDFRGKAVPNVTDWQYLNMNYKIIARIDQDLCIKCGLCHIACEDTSHQSIAAERVDGQRRYRVIDEECVGCNLCQHVCPVPGLHHHGAGRYRLALSELDAASAEPDAQGGGGVIGGAGARRSRRRHPPPPDPPPQGGRGEFCGGFMSTNIRIDSDRLWQSLMELAKIGATEKGGVCRLALTDLDRQARDLFRQWCEAAGCSLTVDKMGNIFARRPGKDNSLPPVMTGSHIDTQPTGGKFDGNYGVMSGLEVIRTLNDFNYETTRPIEVVVWTNEEGSRFAPAMVASGVFAGVFDLDYGLSRKDVDGKSMGEELAAHRLCRGDRLRRPAHRRLLRGPYRAGADPGGGGQDHRRGPGGAGHPLVRDHRDGAGGPCRADAYAPAEGCPAGRLAHGQCDQPHRPRPSALCLRHRRHAPGLAQFAQRHPGQGLLHHRFPPSRCRGAEGHGSGGQGRMREDRRRDRPRARLQGDLVLAAGEVRR